MQLENLNMTVNGDIQKPIEVIFREGEAVKPEYPKKYEVKGVIGAPAAFAERLQAADKAKLVVVEYSYQNKTIILKEDPTNQYAATVVGELTLNPDLMSFGVNKDKFFKSSDLIALVRKNAHCFKSLEDAKKLIKELQSFEVKFVKTHKKEDDRRGNTEDSVKETIEYHKGEIGTQLTLCLPFFVGGKKVDFSVEIEIESRDAAPAFGFYSLDLEAKLREATQIDLDTVIEVLRSKFTCIQLS